MITGIFTGFIAIFFLLWHVVSSEPASPQTILYGGLSAVCFVGTIICYYFAMRTGPLSYTTFFFSASMMIPALAGIFLWKEPISLAGISGLLLFLAAFYFISVAGNKSAQASNGKWMLFCFLSWLLNGCNSVVGKLQQTALNGTEYISMMAVSFSAACLLCLIFYAALILSIKKGGTVGQDIQLVFASCRPILLVAVGSGIGNIALLFLSSRLAGAYLFPFVLGGLILVVTLYSRIVLKESMNRMGIIGIALGLLAIVAINL